MTVMVAAEAWRQNEAENRRTRSLRERFIRCMWGKLNFSYHWLGLRSSENSARRGLHIAEKPPFFDDAVTMALADFRVMVFRRINTSR